MIIKGSYWKNSSHVCCGLFSEPALNALTILVAFQSPAFAFSLLYIVYLKIF